MDNGKFEAAAANVRRERGRIRSDDGGRWETRRWTGWPRAGEARRHRRAFKRRPDALPLRVRLVS